MHRKKLLRREQCAPNTFRRVVARYEMLKDLSETENKARLAFSKAHANQLWQADTMWGPYVSHKGKTVPTSWGLAVSWWPTGFPTLFPYSWKVVAVIDAYSRKVLATRAFRKEPSADAIIATLDAAVADEGCTPRHLVTDKGSLFFSTKNKKPSAALQLWLNSNHVKARFGAVGKKGSIAIIERFFRTLKQEGIRRMMVPFDTEWLHAELDVFAEWYNTKRPHASLHGATPDERHRGIAAPALQPRYEARPRFPVSENDIDSGQVWRAKVVKLDASHFKRRKHLPDISLDVAA